MYRLAELSDSRRKQMGWGLLLVGLAGLVLGVIWIHWSSIPRIEVIDGVETEVVVDYLNWFPRGVLWKGIGYLIVLAATTMTLVGALFLWVLNQPLTWVRAAIAAFIAWMALVFFFGMVPSEWLNYAQTDLDWSSQRVALSIPPALMLGNQVDISWAAVKDAISGGYHVVMLGVAAVVALEIQKMRQGRPTQAPAEKVSPYGRPLVRGEG
ncbi:MAG: hypothetical protein ACRDVL_13650 [Acidimicrobiia bacterium]